MSRKEPIYQTILNALILELNTSRFRKNDPFYSESELCSQIDLKQCVNAIPLKLSIQPANINIRMW